MTDPIDRLLVNVLRRPATPADPCPEADVLGAYALGELGADERSPIERHVSNCQRCAAHVAQFVTLEDALPSPQTTIAGKWPWLRWTWAVPVAAALVVAAVWVAQPHVPVPSTRVAREVSAPDGRSSSSPSATAPQRPPEATDELADSLVPAPAIKAKPARQPKAPPAAPAPPEARNGRRPEQDRARQEERGLRAEAAAPPQDATVQGTAPPAPSSAAEKMAEREAARGDLAPADAETTAQSNAAAEMKRAARPGPKEMARSTGPIAGFGGDTAAGAPIEIPSPVAAVRWRIAPTTIERTTDGGATWHDDGAPAARNVRYGVAISEDVCWFATPTGTVLRRAADGAWTTAQVPGHPVIRALTASSSLEAAITSTDGRVFRTSDGGITWTEGTQRR
jgi:hypothetical protein